jgi:hypothetical protein
LEKAAKNTHLQINQAKRKDMPVAKKGCAGGTSFIEIDPLNLKLCIISLTWDQRSTEKMTLASGSKNVSFLQVDVFMDLRNIRSPSLSQGKLN